MPALICHSSMVRRWRHEIQVAIQRRRAAMVRAVLPKPVALAEWIVSGQTSGMPSCGGRQQPLQQEAGGLAGSQNSRGSEPREFSAGFWSRGRP